MPPYRSEKNREAPGEVVSVDGGGGSTAIAAGATREVRGILLVVVELARDHGDCTKTAEYSSTACLRFELAEPRTFSAT